MATSEKGTMGESSAGWVRSSLSYGLGGVHTTPETVSQPSQLMRAAELLKICADYPAEAVKALSGTGIEEAQVAELVARFGKRFRRMRMDVSQEQEKRIMDLEHDLERELQRSGVDVRRGPDNQIGALLDNPEPVAPAGTSPSALKARAAAQPSTPVSAAVKIRTRAHQVGRRRWHSGAGIGRDSADVCLAGPTRPVEATWVGRVFISYRRVDAGPYARLLKIGLEEELPDTGVFLDLDSVEAGTDVPEAIRSEVAASLVLVVLIGPTWISLRDDRGRRLDNPEDYVRLEIRTALERGIHVVPVLVDGACMPRPHELPGDIAKLGQLSAQALSCDRYWYDVGRIVSVIRRMLGSATGGPLDPAARQTRS